MVNSIYNGYRMEDGSATGEGQGEDDNEAHCKCSCSGERDPRCSLGGSPRLRPEVGGNFESIYARQSGEYVDPRGSDTPCPESDDGGIQQFGDVRPARN